MIRPPWSPGRLSWACWGISLFILGVLVLEWMDSWGGQPARAAVTPDALLGSAMWALLGWLEWRWPTFGKRGSGKDRK